MMNVLRSLLISAILVCPLDTLATEDIRFGNGQVTGTVRGEVTSTIKTYQFRARKGQRLNVTLTPVGRDKASLSLTLYACCGEEYGKPLVSESINWRGQLPCTDRYTLDVAPSVNTMRQARAQRYTLTMTII